MTFAIHIAATSLTLHNYDVLLNNMKLYSLPLVANNDLHRTKTGSIELVKKTIVVQSKFDFEDIEIPSPESPVLDKAKTINVPEFDLIVMNPPFTKTAYNNLLFGGVGTAEQQKQIKKALNSIKNIRRLKANLTAGLGSIFIAVADKLLKNEGVMSLITPKTLLEGSSWTDTREIINDYNIEFIITSHEWNNWNFSESSDLSEIMFIISRPKFKESKTVYVNLSKQPETMIEALSVVTSITQTPIPDIDEKGIKKLKVGSKYYGETVSIDLKRSNIPWVLPANFLNTDLIRIAVDFFNKNLKVGSRKKTMKMRKLSDLATLGPDGRDIYDGFDPVDSFTIYSALWGNAASEISTITLNSNKFLAPLTSPRPSRRLKDSSQLWNLSGTLMLTKGTRLDTTSLIAIILPQRCLSNVWWPVRYNSENQDLSSKMEIIISMWLNSTLGIFSVLMRRQETEGAWMKFPKTWWEYHDIIDISLFTSEQVEKCIDLWNQIKNEPFLLINKLSSDQIRKRIDDLFSEILNIPDVKNIRDLLSNEPLLNRP